ncbi:hypothetical protein JTE90_012270 [Oedothorax gibbosus]|uniref:RBR-type E3 ubiquitin transferase n=1 Tax=Oedothorax gibbosus TaxID=931172 RepID=A0AAV6VJX3_9ARAC|nr:hypothetical protein JTE90_012270 [Oedothorax gibbosus]
MYHRHPKRKLHLRKAVDSIWNSSKSLRLRRRTELPGDPSKIPIPPPRSKKRERHTIGGGRLFLKQSHELGSFGHSKMFDLRTIAPPPKDIFAGQKTSPNKEGTYENETSMDTTATGNVAAGNDIYENENIPMNTRENVENSNSMGQVPWNMPRTNIASPIQVSIPSNSPDMIANGQSFGYPMKPQSRSIADLTGPPPVAPHPFHLPHYPYMHPHMHPQYSHSAAHLNCAQCMSSSWSNLMSPHPSPYFHPMPWGSLARGVNGKHGSVPAFPDPNFHFSYPAGAFYPNGAPMMDPNFLPQQAPESQKVKRSRSGSRHTQSPENPENMEVTTDSAPEVKVEENQPSNQSAPRDVKRKTEIDDEPPKIPDPPSRPWSCLHCTYVNPPGIHICEVCCKTSYGNTNRSESQNEGRSLDSRNSDSPMELVNLDALSQSPDFIKHRVQKDEDSIGADSLETEEIPDIKSPSPFPKTPEPTTMLTTETQTSTTTKTTDVQTQNLVFQSIDTSTDSIFPRQEISVQTETETTAKNCSVATDPMISSQSMESLMSGFSAPPYQNRRAGWGRGACFSTQSLYDRPRSKSPIPRSLSEAQSFVRDSSLPPEEAMRSWSQAWLGSDPMYFKSHGKEDYFDGTWGSMDKLNRRVKSKQGEKFEVNSRPKLHRSLDDLKAEKTQDIVHSRELQFLQTVKEAERCGFSLEDLHVAYLHCGKENPVFWLEDNWSFMIKNVIALAAKYGEDNEENDVGVITASEAKQALHIHRGDIWDAVTECIENRQRKILELTVRGNFTQKQISDALKNNEGNVELAYADLLRASTRRHKFILSPGLSEDSEYNPVEESTTDHSVSVKAGKLDIPTDSKADKKKSDFLTKLSAIRQAQSERRKAREEKEMIRDTTTAPETGIESPLSEVVDAKNLEEETSHQDPVSEEAVEDIEKEIADAEVDFDAPSMITKASSDKEDGEDHIQEDYDTNWVESQGEWIEEYEEEWNEEADTQWVSLQKKYQSMEKEFEDEAKQMAALWEKEELDDDVFEEEPKEVPDLEVGANISDAERAKLDQDEKFQQWVKVNLEQKSLSETEEIEPNIEPLKLNLSKEPSLSRSVEFDDRLMAESPLQHYPTKFDLSLKTDPDWIELENEEKDERDVEVGTNVEKESKGVENSDEEWEKIDMEIDMLNEEEIEAMTSVPIVDSDQRLLSKASVEQKQIKTHSVERNVVGVQDSFEGHSLSIITSAPDATELIADKPTEVAKPKPPVRRKSKLNTAAIEEVLKSRQTPGELSPDVPPALPLKRKDKSPENTLKDIYAVPDKHKPRVEEKRQGETVPLKKEKFEAPEVQAPIKPPRVNLSPSMDAEAEIGEKKSLNSGFSKDASPVTSLSNESDCFADSESDPEIKIIRQKYMHRKPSKYENEEDDFFDDIESPSKLEESGSPSDLRKEVELQSSKKAIEFDPELPIPIGTRGNRVVEVDEVESPKAFREGTARPLQLFKVTKQSSTEMTPEPNNAEQTKDIDAMVSGIVKAYHEHSSEIPSVSSIANESLPLESKMTDNQMEFYANEPQLSYQGVVDPNYYNTSAFEQPGNLQTIQESAGVSYAPEDHLPSDSVFPIEPIPEESLPISYDEQPKNEEEELAFAEMKSASAAADYFFGRYDEVTVAKPKKRATIAKGPKVSTPAAPKVMSTSEIVVPPVVQPTVMEKSASPAMTSSSTSIAPEAVPPTTVPPEAIPKVAPQKAPRSPKAAPPADPEKEPEYLPFADDYFFGSYNEVVVPKKGKKKVPPKPIPKVPEKAKVEEVVPDPEPKAVSPGISLANSSPTTVSSVLQHAESTTSLYFDTSSLMEDTFYLAEMSEQPADNVSLSSSDKKGKSVHFVDPQPAVVPPPRKNRPKPVDSNRSSVSSFTSATEEFMYEQYGKSSPISVVDKKKLQSSSEDFKLNQEYDPSNFSCDSFLQPSDQPECDISSEISVFTSNEPSNTIISPITGYFGQNIKHELSEEFLSRELSDNDNVDNFLNGQTSLASVSTFASDNVTRDLNLEEYFPENEKTSEISQNSKLFKEGSSSASNKIPEDFKSNKTELVDQNSIVEGSIIQSSSLNSSALEISDAPKETINADNEINKAELKTFENASVSSYTAQQTQTDSRKVEDGKADIEVTSHSINENVIGTIEKAIPEGQSPASDILISDSYTVKLESGSVNNRILDKEAEEEMDQDPYSVHMDDDFEDGLLLVEEAENLINEFCDIYPPGLFDLASPNEFQNLNTKNNKQESIYDSEQEWKLNEERYNSLNANFIENKLYKSKGNQEIDDDKELIIDTKSSVEGLEVRDMFLDASTSDSAGLNDIDELARISDIGELVGISNIGELTASNISELTASNISELNTSNFGELAETSNIGKLAQTNKSGKQAEISNVGELAETSCIDEQTKASSIAKDVLTVSSKSDIYFENVPTLESDSVGENFKISETTSESMPTNIVQPLSVLCQEAASTMDFESTCSKSISLEDFEGVTDEEALEYSKSELLDASFDVSDESLATSTRSSISTQIPVPSDVKLQDLVDELDYEIESKTPVQPSGEEHTETFSLSTDDVVQAGSDSASVPSDLKIQDLVDELDYEIESKTPVQTSVEEDIRTLNMSLSTDDLKQADSDLVTVSSDDKIEDIVEKLDDEIERKTPVETSVEHTGTLNINTDDLDQADSNLVTDKTAFALSGLSETDDDTHCPSLVEKDGVIQNQDGENIVVVPDSTTPTSLRTDSDPNVKADNLSTHHSMSQAFTTDLETMDSVTVVLSSQPIEDNKPSLMEIEDFNNEHGVMSAGSSSVYPNQAEGIEDQIDIQQTVLLAETSFETTASQSSIILPDSSQLSEKEIKDGDISYLKYVLTEGETDQVPDEENIEDSCESVMSHFYDEWIQDVKASEKSSILLQDVRSKYAAYYNYAESSNSDSASENEEFAQTDTTALSNLESHNIESCIKETHYNYAEHSISGIASENEEFVPTDIITQTTLESQKIESPIKETKALVVGDEFKSTSEQFKNQNIFTSDSAIKKTHEEQSSNLPRADKPEDQHKVITQEQTIEISREFSDIISKELDVLESNEQIIKSVGVKEKIFTTTKSCQTDDSFEEDLFFDSFDDPLMDPTLYLPVDKKINIEPVTVEIGIQCHIITSDALIDSDKIVQKSEIKTYKSEEIQVGQGTVSIYDNPIELNVTEPKKVALPDIITLTKEDSSFEISEDSDSDIFLEPQSSHDELKSKNFLCAEIDSGFSSGSDCGYRTDKQVTDTEDLALTSLTTTKAILRYANMPEEEVKMSELPIMHETELTSKVTDVAKEAKMHELPEESIKVAEMQVSKSNEQINESTKKLSSSLVSQNITTKDNIGDAKVSESKSKEVVKGETHKLSKELLTATKTSISQSNEQTDATTKNSSSVSTLQSVATKEDSKASDSGTCKFILETQTHEFYEEESLKSAEMSISTSNNQINEAARETTEASTLQNVTIKEDVEFSDSDAFDVSEEGDIFERAVTPVSIEKVPSIEDLDFIELKTDITEQVVDPESIVRSECCSTPTVEYFYGPLPGAVMSSIPSEDNDYFVEALDLLDASASQHTKHHVDNVFSSLSKDNSISKSDINDSEDLSESLSSFHEFDDDSLTESASEYFLPSDNEDKATSKNIHELKVLSTPETSCVPSNQSFDKQVVSEIKSEVGKSFSELSSSTLCVRVPKEEIEKKSSDATESLSVEPDSLNEIDKTCDASEFEDSLYMESTSEYSLPADNLSKLSEKVTLSTTKDDMSLIPQEEFKKELSKTTRSLKVCTSLSEVQIEKYNLEPLVPIVNDETHNQEQVKALPEISSADVQVVTSQYTCIATQATDSEETQPDSSKIDIQKPSEIEPKPINDEKIELPVETTLSTSAADKSLYLESMQENFSSEIVLTNSEKVKSSLCSSNIPDKSFVENADKIIAQEEIHDKLSVDNKTDPGLTKEIPSEDINEELKITSYKSDLPPVPSDIVRYLYYGDDITFEEDLSTHDNTSFNSAQNTGPNSFQSLDSELKISKKETEDVIKNTLPLGPSEDKFPEMISQDIQISSDEQSAEYQYIQTVSSDPDGFKSACSDLESSDQWHELDASSSLPVHKAVAESILKSESSTETNSLTKEDSESPCIPELILDREAKEIFPVAKLDSDEVTDISSHFTMTEDDSDKFSDIESDSSLQDFETDFGFLNDFQSKKGVAVLESVKEEADQTACSKDNDELLPFKTNEQSTDENARQGEVVLDLDSNENIELPIQVCALGEELNNEIMPEDFPSPVKDFNGNVTENPVASELETAEIMPPTTEKVSSEPEQEFNIPASKEVKNIPLDSQIPSTSSVTETFEDEFCDVSQTTESCYTSPLVEPDNWLDAGSESILETEHSDFVMPNEDVNCVSAPENNVPVASTIHSEIVSQEMTSNVDFQKDIFIQKDSNKENGSSSLNIENVIENACCSSSEITSNSESSVIKYIKRNEALEEINPLNSEVQSSIKPEQEISIPDLNQVESTSSSEYHGLSISNTENTLEDEFCDISETTESCYTSPLVEPDNWLDAGSESILETEHSDFILPNEDVKSVSTPENNIPIAITILSEKDSQEMTSNVDFQQDVCIQKDANKGNGSAISNIENPIENACCSKSEIASNSESSVINDIKRNEAQEEINPLSSDVQSSIKPEQEISIPDLNKLENISSSEYHSLSTSSTTETLEDEFCDISETTESCYTSPLVEPDNWLDAGSESILETNCSDFVMLNEAVDNVLTPTPKNITIDSSVITNEEFSQKNLNVEFQQDIVKEKDTKKESYFSTSNIENVGGHASCSISQIASNTEDIVPTDIKSNGAPQEINAIQVLNMQESKEPFAEDSFSLRDIGIREMEIVDDKKSIFESEDKSKNEVFISDALGQAVIPEGESRKPDETKETKIEGLPKDSEVLPSVVSEVIETECVLNFGNKEGISVPFQSNVGHEVQKESVAQSEPEFSTESVGTSQDFISSDAVDNSSVWKGERNIDLDEQENTFSFAKYGYLIKDGKLPDSCDSICEATPVSPLNVDSLKCVKTNTISESNVVSGVDKPETFLEIELLEESEQNIITMGQISSVLYPTTDDKQHSKGKEYSYLVEPDNSQEDSFVHIQPQDISTTNANILKEQTPHIQEVIENLHGTSAFIISPDEVQPNENSLEVMPLVSKEISSFRDQNGNVETARKESLTKDEVTDASFCTLSGDSDSWHEEDSEALVEDFLTDKANENIVDDVIRHQVVEEEKYDERERIENIVGSDSLDTISPCPLDSLNSNIQKEPSSTSDPVSYSETESVYFHSACDNFDNASVITSDEDFTDVASHFTLTEGSEAFSDAETDASTVFDDCEDYSFSDVREETPTRDNGGYTFRDEDFYSFKGHLVDEATKDYQTESLSEIKVHDETPVREETISESIVEVLESAIKQPKSEDQLPKATEEYRTESLPEFKVSGETPVSEETISECKVEVLESLINQQQSENQLPEDTPSKKCEPVLEKDIAKESFTTIDDSSKELNQETNVSCIENINDSEQIALCSVALQEKIALDKLEKTINEPILILQDTKTNNLKVDTEIAIKKGTVEEFSDIGNEASEQSSHSAFQTISKDDESQIFSEIESEIYGEFDESLSKADDNEQSEADFIPFAEESGKATVKRNKSAKKVLDVDIDKTANVKNNFNDLNKDIDRAESCESTFKTQEEYVSTKDGKRTLSISIADIVEASDLHHKTDETTETLLLEHFADIKSLSEPLATAETFTIFEPDIAVLKIHEDLGDVSLHLEMTEDSDYWLEAETEYSISEFEDEAVSLSVKDPFEMDVNNLSDHHIYASSSQYSDATAAGISTAFYSDTEYSDQMSDTCADISLQGGTTESSDKWSDIEGDAAIDEALYGLAHSTELNKEGIDAAHSFSLEGPQETKRDLDTKINSDQPPELPIVETLKKEESVIEKKDSSDIKNLPIASEKSSDSVSENYTQPLSDPFAGNISASGVSEEDFTSVTPLDVTADELDKWSDISDDLSPEELQYDSLKLTLKKNLTSSIVTALDTSSEFTSVKPPKKVVPDNEKDDQVGANMELPITIDQNLEIVSKIEDRSVPQIPEGGSIDKILKMDEQNTESTISANGNVVTENIIYEEITLDTIEEDAETESPVVIGKEEAKKTETDEAEAAEEEVEPLSTSPAYENEDYENYDDNFEDYEYQEGEEYDINENEMEFEEGDYPDESVPYIENEDELVYPLQTEDWIEESFDLKEYGVEYGMSGSETDVHGYGIHDEYEDMQRAIDFNLSNFDDAIDENLTTESFKTLSNTTPTQSKLTEHESWSTADADSICDDLPEHDDVLSKIDELLAEDFDYFKDDVSPDLQRNENVTISPIEDSFRTKDAEIGDFMVIRSQSTEESLKPLVETVESNIDQKTITVEKVIGNKTKSEIKDQTPASLEVASDIVHNVDSSSSKITHEHPESLKMKESYQLESKDILTNQTEAKISSEESKAKTSSDESKSVEISDNLKSKISSEQSKAKILSEESKAKISSDESKTVEVSDNLKTKLSSVDSKAKISSKESKAKKSSDDSKSEVSSDELKTVVVSDDLKSKISCVDSKAKISSEESKTVEVSDNLKTKLSSVDSKAKISSEVSKAKKSSDDSKSKVSSDELKTVEVSDSLKTKVLSDELESKVSSDESTTYVISEDSKRFTAEKPSEEVSRNILDVDTFKTANKSDTLTEEKVNETASIKSSTESPEQSKSITVKESTQIMSDVTSAVDSNFELITEKTTESEKLSTSGMENDLSSSTLFKEVAPESKTDSSAIVKTVDSDTAHEMKQPLKKKENSKSDIIETNIAESAKVISSTSIDNQAMDEKVKENEISFESKKQPLKVEKVLKEEDASKVNLNTQDKVENASVAFIDKAIVKKEYESTVFPKKEAVSTKMEKEVKKEESTELFLKTTERKNENTSATSVDKPIVKKESKEIVSDIPLNNKEEIGKPIASKTDSSTAQTDVVVQRRRSRISSSQSVEEFATSKPESKELTIEQTPSKTVEFPSSEQTDTFVRRRRSRIASSQADEEELPAKTAEHFSEPDQTDTVPRRRRSRITSQDAEEESTTTKPDIPLKRRRNSTLKEASKAPISSPDDQPINSNTSSSDRPDENISKPDIPEKRKRKPKSEPELQKQTSEAPSLPPKTIRRDSSTDSISSSVFLSSSSESLSCYESASMKESSKSETVLKPDVPDRKIPVKPKRRESSDDTSSSSINRSSSSRCSYDLPPKESMDLCRKRTSIDERMVKLQVAGKCQTKEAAFIAAKLIEMQFEEEDSLLASRQCTSIYHAVKFLTQLCDLCQCRFPINSMASMIHCAHRACKECLKAHFTNQIYDRSIFTLLCPICQKPDITDQNIQEYFNHLEMMFRNILDSHVYDLFQKKLRDEVLTKDPNFHWCSQCSSGFIASPRLKKLYCPDCSAITCALCHQTWELEHEGVHCERFQQWKDMHTPEPPPAGLVKLLTDRGITCPSCDLNFSQASAGCMMYKCSHCSFEFCGFCSKPYKRGKDCGNKQCESRGNHAHHPFSCLFFLRDKDVSELQMLLDEESVKYLTIPPKDQIVKSRCQVREQKHIHGSLAEDRCGRDIVPYCAGLCKTHYYEYLAELLRQNKINPLSLMTTRELEFMLRKSRCPVPEKVKGESNEEFYERLTETVTLTLS